MKTKALNVYFIAPLLWDALLIGLIVLILHFFAKYLPLITLDLPTVLDSLASTAISLAGFILTGLTIIVSIRANLSYKGINESNSGIELLFNSWAYGSIVKIFKGAIIGLILSALLLYLALIFSGTITYRHIILISIICFIEIFMSMFRCLYILFKIITIEIKSSVKDQVS
ncbi:hypothetical protein [Hymenobacter psychrophilus]|uniref:hypothetical protein n=1 Tax=Hymenobacter psychrophilus TaxID=651662 RepID=UPI00111500B9|nr:hypothetical protein [Hymenobacter psychrophilus]